MTQRRPRKGRPRAGKPKSPGRSARTLTAKAIAEHLGVSPRTVYDWRKRGCPDDDLDAVKTWIAEDGDRRKRRKPGALEERELLRGRVDQVQLDYRSAKTEIEQLKLQRLRGELVDAEEVDEMLTRRALELRRALEDLVHRLPPQLVSADERGAARILKESFRKMLERYTRTHHLGNGK